MAHTQARSHHFWLPVPHDDVPGGIRHAFRGARWAGEPSGLTVCGRSVALARPSEVDWINFPSCGACNEILREEQA